MRLTLITLVTIVCLSACTNTPTSDNTGVIKVVAAENFWGSIAEQIGGSHVREVSIINNPDTDPHDYDPTAADSRTVADAQLAIVNGVGYDPWADKLLAANPHQDRKTINVGAIMQHKNGDNPHRWYSPTDVATVITSIGATLKLLDPNDAAYFDQQVTKFETINLGSYNQLLQSIKTRFANTPVGATESIFSPLADNLGLNLITPTTFLTAISEGNAPTAADKAVADRQITDREIKVLIYNSQNATPDVQRLLQSAKAAGIPVVAVTETLSPAGSTFQDWQTSQLAALQNALT